jgi:prepilin-type N-terminal cleavage/methylation domain-containing protein
MRLVLSSLRCAEALGRSRPLTLDLLNPILRASRFASALLARKSRETSGPRIFRASGFTLIELTITIAVILILVGAASLGIKPYYAYRDGRAAGEMLRAVKAAQLMYLSDYPSALVTSLTGGATGNITPYMPNGVWPTMPLVNGTAALINCTQFPPVAVLTVGGATYDPSGSPTDGLWDVGLY